jgi:hypothetical protein
MPDLAQVIWFTMDEDVLWDSFMEKVNQGSLINIVDLAHELTGDSKSQCRRLIKDGAFKWNGVKLQDEQTWVDIKSGQFYRIDLKELSKLAEQK